MPGGLRNTITSALQVGMTIADMTRRGKPTVFVNDAFVALTGYSREEAVGRNLHFLQGPETDADTAKRLGRAIRAGRPITVEILNYRKDGSKFWNLLSVAPLPDADGRVTRMVGVQRDVSDLKAHQQERETAQRLAALGQLAGGVAHDFNNLLAVVTGCVGLLAEKTQGSPELAPLIRAVQVATARGTAQVKRLMALTDSPMLDLQPLDLRAIAANVELMLTPGLPPGLLLTSEVPDEARWVLGDAPQLENALINLVLNAREAIGGAGIIRISSRAEVHDAESWNVLAVEDTGAGMDDSTIERIFDPFFSTRQGRGGHGLGLTMVHSYVRASGGGISVHSLPGRGSRFELRLPAAAAPPQAPAPALPPEATWTGRVLLIEDDDVLRMTTAAMLGRLGHEVVACADATAALERIERGPPVDLVCTDYLLGGELTGLDLADAVRRRWPGVPIVLLSGWTDAGVDLGRFDTFLPKPYTLELLASAIDQARARRRPATG